jgi:hypothetical protein
MYTGIYDIPRYQLNKSSHVNLLRLAKYIGLKYNLENMSHKQLSKLVRWKLTRREMRR